MSALENLSSGLGISNKKETELAEEIIRNYDVKTPDMKRKLCF